MDPVRCKIIKCGRLMQEVATTAADLAIADETAYTPEQAEAIISALETAEEKIRPLLPA